VLRLKMVLAESAVRHDDGTVSVLREGINRVFCKVGEPATLHAAAVLHICIPAGEEMSGEIFLNMLDGKGGDHPIGKVNFVHQPTAEVKPPSTFSIAVPFLFKTVGRGIRSVVARHEDRELDRWDIRFEDREGVDASAVRTVYDKRLSGESSPNEPAGGDVVSKEP